MIASCHEYDASGSRDRLGEDAFDDRVLKRLLVAHGHVRAAQPQWGAVEIAADRTAVILYLVIVDATGLAGWLISLAAVRRGWRKRGMVTALFAVGMGALVLSAGGAGGAYDRIVPLRLGMTLLCPPALPGITALVAVWRGTDR
ncbi:hypothetical protein KGD83_17375 [Nocardiopsis akebiae]|uniref:Uncharacterized protein n=1 Tax=Nocardiopsis akebiae TaxID=2831968 RepID=A0ABX8BY46_9ACTN|nr:hypothetical protein [Nocardiopsis akebiae]QUX27110.1 hypothetical protein KGD83_17375 [Nocardiopsis akebiae]